MVIFDTNAVLRYILQDNAAMADAVDKELALNNCLLPMEVIAEIVYVLSKVYRIDRLTIAKTIEGIMRISHIWVYRPNVVLCAIQTYASTKLDFIDCLLAGYAKSENHTIYTFDRELKKYLSR
ncbi:MAG: PIN domain-containing protein [Prevotellaceae bacterium]|jgi:predicted nucleic-acid-binding protein|nr:PIN domain-containing protein [Prevotellaceae bacterium]